ncbi:MAG: Maf family protein [bacterium]|nr:Maf family protein [bacterium]
MKIILGTASKHRKKIFEEMGYRDFEVMAADIDEKAIRFEDPEKLTLALANAKADALVQRIKEPALLITADQVVSWNGEIREKPESEEQAQEYFRTYHMAPAIVVNGIVVTNTATGKRVSGGDRNTVVFRQIPSEAMEALIQDPATYTYAGGFSLFTPALKPFIERIEGDVDSIEGLPRQLTQRLLGEAE